MKTAYAPATCSDRDDAELERRILSAIRPSTTAASTSGPRRS
jgi:hypothetical protein